MSHTVTLTEAQVASLSGWWLAIRWSRFALEDKINAAQRSNHPPSSYDADALKQVLEAETFLYGLFNSVIIADTGVVPTDV
jgi:ABC-type glycerol-3-phosphate transport system permease component